MKPVQPPLAAFLVMTYFLQGRGALALLPDPLLRSISTIIYCKKEVYLLTFSNFFRNYTKLTVLVDLSDITFFVFHLSFRSISLCVS